MEHAGIDPDAFNAFEAAGWEERAQAYDRSFCSLTSRLAVEHTSSFRHRRGVEARPAT